MNQNSSPGVAALIFFLRQRGNIARAFAVFAVAAGAAQMIKRLASLGRLRLVGVPHLLG